MSGVVLDSTGRPLENAVIVLDPNGGSRATRADAQGRFRFERVAQGQHLLRATWVGYRPDERTVEVKETDVHVVVILADLPYALDTLRIVAQQTGMFGVVVAASDFRALGAAQVEVLDGRCRRRTAADGRFACGELREGAYVVETSRARFKTRLLSVPVPPKGAVEVAIALDSQITKADELREAFYRDLNFRWHRAGRVSATLVPSHELAAHRRQSLDFALRYAPSFAIKGFTLRDVECVYVDGRLALGMRLKDFSADDIAMLEVYSYNSGRELRVGASADRPDCGLTSEKNVLVMKEGPNVKGGEMVYYRAPDPWVVVNVYIWLKH